mgnify:FL=1
MCGEKEDMKKAGLNPIGSPPRVRGKVACQGPRVARYRITPAYAGKSLRHSLTAYILWDHPRVCGEKSKYRLQINWWLGSPPRMRGKEQAAVQMGVRLGITPAYAGKSVHRSGLHRTEGDHPRVCGEKIYPLLAIASPLGSPPRVRGKG